MTILTSFIGKNVVKLVAGQSFDVACWMIGINQAGKSRIWLQVPHLTAFRFVFTDKMRVPTHKLMEKARLDTFDVGNGWIHDQVKNHSANSKMVRFKTLRWVFFYISLDGTRRFRLHSTTKQWWSRHLLVLRYFSKWLGCRRWSDVGAIYSYLIIYWSAHFNCSLQGGTSQKKKIVSFLFCLWACTYQ